MTTSHVPPTCTLQSLPAWFTATPSGRELADRMRAEALEQRESRRAELLTDLAALEADHQRSHKKAAAEASKAEKAYIKARSAMAEAYKAATEANAHAAGLSTTFENRRFAIVRELREVAPVEITEAIERWADEMERVRNLTPVTWYQDDQRCSNKPQLLELFQAIRAAVDELRKLPERDVPNMAEAISNITANLPAPGTADEHYGIEETAK